MRLALIALGLLALTGCATIPNGRYGVTDVQVEGLEQLDEAALRACLGTRERSQLGIDFGASSSLSCGDPPFDSDRVHADLFAWPWTEWPLFDPSVFERDLRRVERWLRARGYYEGRVVATTVDPPEATGAPTEREEGAPPPSHCIAGPGRGCEVRVSIQVEEGEPVRVARVEIRAGRAPQPDVPAPDEEEQLDRELRRALRDVLELQHGDVFDEAIYEETKRAMVRVLANGGYPDARVEGDVKINTERHEAYVLFWVSPGPRGVLGRICVEGYGELPARTILAATYLEPGQTFSLDAIEEAQRAIFGLGTLSSVEIEHTLEEDDPDRVNNPEPIVDPNDPPAEEGAEGDAGSDEPEASQEPEQSEVGSASEQPEQLRPPARPPHCTEPPSSVPEGTRIVDLTINVTPGRLERIGVGLGLQAGDTLSFGNASAGGSLINQQLLQQWDIHLLFIAEWRNLFGDMLRLRLEERPRVIFPAPFPGVENEAGLGPSLGNKILVNIRWPAFIEPRTALFASLAHDYGPIPLYSFFRHELDGRIGLERNFFDGRFYLSAALRGNLFLPEARGNDLRVQSQRETTRTLFFEQIATLDLRDDPRNPSLGAFFALSVQEAGWAGVSSWDYFRVTAEARGYVPLGLGIVVAARFGIGAMFILNRYDLARDNIYDLYSLGPLSQQLQGGGSVSNRGFPPGLEGDVVRRRVVRRPLPGGEQGAQTIIVSGGTRRWEGSLELRLPITPEIGLTLFADVGNVSRPDANGNEDFRFEVLNFAFGFGLRYRTVIGPLRFDMAFRPDALQSLSDNVPTRLRPCENDADYECRPVPEVNLGFVTFPGAIHLTIGEAF